MSITSTDGKFHFETIEAITPLIPNHKFKPNFMKKIIKFGASVTGDASGGDVVVDVDYGAILADDDYLCLTNIMAYCSSSQDNMMYTHSDRWKELLIPGLADKYYSIWAGNSVFYSCGYNDYIKGMIPLGQINTKDADKGLCHIRYGTNTESASYQVHIQAFILAEPLPFGYHNLRG